jgi:hypothetical protein
MTIVINGTTGITNVNGTAAAPAETGTDTDSGIVYGTNTVSLATNGTTALTVDASQNVGIGTTVNNVYDQVASARPLVVQKSDTSTTLNGSTSSIIIANGDTTTNNTAQLNFAAITGASTNQYSSAIISAIFGARTNGQYPTGQLAFSTSTTLNAAPTEKMRIDSSGNVGIGQSSITQLFGNYTQLNISGSSGATIQMQSGSTIRANMIADANNFYIYGLTSIAFGVGGTGTGTNRMNIDSNGALILVGSTAQKATGTTWSNPSDQRLKNNIRDYAKGTTELMQVRVREWEYNGKGGTTEGMKGLGVVADEVMTVLPNTVETYDAKLNAEDEEKTAIKKFDATEITWLLVKTVQEQQALITTLTARITALEANNG